MKNKILYLAATLTKPLFRWFLIVWICIILVASISGIYINKTPLINPEENIPTDENI